MYPRKKCKNHATSASYKEFASEKKGEKEVEECLYTEIIKKKVCIDVETRARNIKCACVCLQIVKLFARVCGL